MYEILFLSSDLHTLDEWRRRDDSKDIYSFDNLESLLEASFNLEKTIVIADYDSVAADINKMLTNNQIPPYCIVLEKVPELLTGKMLISHGIKAYGNSRMLKIHYEQMIQSVQKGKVWTYPELTATLAKSIRQPVLSKEAETLLHKRLTEKEKEVVKLVLKGFTNDAIAKECNITQRTVKAHMSSIFSKLHVNDRLGLVLLLK